MTEVQEKIKKCSNIKEIKTILNATYSDFVLEYTAAEEFSIIDNIVDEAIYKICKMLNMDRWELEKIISKQITNSDIKSCDIFQLASRIISACRGFKNEADFVSELMKIQVIAMYK